MEYTILRAWELELDAVLRGSLATLPLSPITNQARGQLPQVLRRMQDRLDAETSPEERKDLWMDTFVLMGLRQRRQPVAQLFRGIPGMKESDTYQMILEEGIERGRTQEAVRALFLVGSPRLGEPDVATRQRIEAEISLDQVEEWLRHVIAIESWTELLEMRRA